ncbi:MAG TPA: hypothetical protein VF331_00205 [Polyangiales bacterium]
MNTVSSMSLTALLVLLLGTMPACALLGPGADSSSGTKSAHSGTVSSSNFWADAGASRDVGATLGDGAVGVSCDYHASMWSVASPLTLSVGEVPFDSVEYGTLTLGSGGCLKKVVLSVTLGNDYNCSLHVTAGPYVDAQGRLIVSALDMMAGSVCPGFPAAFHGTYLVALDQASSGAVSQASGTLAWQGESCATPGGGLDEHCFTGTFELVLHGSTVDLYSGTQYAPPGSAADAGKVAPGTLDLEGARMQFHTASCDFVSSGELCPKVVTQ